MSKEVENHIFSPLLTYSQLLFCIFVRTTRLFKKKQAEKEEILKQNSIKLTN